MSSPRRRLCAAGVMAGTAWLSLAAAGRAQGPDTLSLERALSYSYPSELVAAPGGSRIAWVINRQGRRDIWTAAGPDYAAHQLTHGGADDGLELTGLSVTDAGTVVYVRGGDHDANWDGDAAPNPASATILPKLEIRSISADGRTFRLLDEGDAPAVSPRGDRVVFTRGGQLWLRSLRDTVKAKQLFYARGQSGSAVWSPDGSKLAFVSDRGDHSFVGVFENDSMPIRWMAPSTARDFMPRWSPDGSRLAFVRLPGSGGAPAPLLERTPSPWSIVVARASDGTGAAVWRSGITLRASYPETAGEANLGWAAGDRLVFLHDADGWPHLYSMPATGGEPRLLTPGPFMAEFIGLSPDRRFIVYGANTGADSDDIDRRHLFRVAVDGGPPEPLTSGAGIEWSPVVTGDGATVAFIGAGTSVPPRVMVLPASGGAPRPVGPDLDRDYPVAQLVVPRKIVLKAADGTEIHAQLFARATGAGRGPAVVFVHGGPSRQMLLGWHYRGYYAHAYAVNQYLASRGYVVLSVNYRLGIGYGHDFHHPAHAGPWGAAEYQDVKAAGEYLRARADVDPSRVGIWGGSYGGLLVALALARNSDIFRTGVDLHGVHDWPTDMGMWEQGRERRPYETSDDADAMSVAWRSSPVADVSAWKSPVLLIQGDDDRNVRFHQTVDLVRRLDAQGVRHEQLVLPDEIHDFLRYASWLAADRATVAWFARELGGN